MGEALGTDSGEHEHHGARPDDVQGPQQAGCGTGSQTDHRDTDAERTAGRSQCRPDSHGRRDADTQNHQPPQADGIGIRPTERRDERTERRESHDIAQTGQAADDEHQGDRGTDAQGGGESRSVQVKA